MTSEISPVAVSREAHAVVDRLARWSPTRWSTDGRAERVHEVVQQLADLGADVEGRPRRHVPPPGLGGTLADQLSVVIHDVLAAEPDAAVLRAARTTLRSLPA